MKLMTSNVLRLNRNCIRRLQVNVLHRRQKNVIRRRCPKNAIRQRRPKNVSRLRRPKNIARRRQPKNAIHRRQKRTRHPHLKNIIHLHQESVNRMSSIICPQASGTNPIIQRTETKQIYQTNQKVRKAVSVQNVTTATAALARLDATSLMPHKLYHRSNVATKDSQAADKRAAILKRVAVNQGTDVSLSNILKASGSITWRKPTMGSSKIAPVVPKPIIASKMLNRADVQAETLSSKHLPIIAEGASKLTPTLTVEASLREPETEHNDIPSSVLKMIEMDLSTREPPAPLPLTVQQSQTSVKSILKRPRSSSSRDPSSDEQPLKAPRVSFSFQLPRPCPSLASSAAKPISTVPKISVRRDLFQTNRVSCIKCHS